MHLEIVNLIITTLNDDCKTIEQMVKWILENLGPDVPLHFTRFFPAYMLTRITPTPVKTMERARNIALKLGLKYVYIGNLPAHEGNGTYCPNCKKRLVHRTYRAILENNIENGKCKWCQYKISGIWE